MNGGKHVEGRSKGLFSRITFREPLFVGGAGNTTGLSEKLPVSAGFKGCIRHLEVNDHIYRFGLEPRGEALKGYGIGKWLHYSDLGLLKELCACYACINYDYTYFA